MDLEEDEGEEPGVSGVVGVAILVGIVGSPIGPVAVSRLLLLSFALLLELLLLLLPLPVLLLMTGHSNSTSTSFAPRHSFPRAHLTPSFPSPIPVPNPPRYVAYRVRHVHTRLYVVSAVASLAPHGIHRWID